MVSAVSTIVASEEAGSPDVRGRLPALEHERCRLDPAHASEAHDIAYAPQLRQLSLRHNRAAVGRRLDRRVYSQQYLGRLEAREEVRDRGRLDDGLVLRDEAADAALEVLEPPAASSPG